MTTQIDLFLVFDGTCRQAVEFYTEVFDIDPDKIRLTQYGDLDRNLIPKEYWEKVMLGEIELFGKRIYMVDYTEFADAPHIVGNNAMITLGLQDADELKRLFYVLKEGGKLIYSLRKTEASELVGIVSDQFGIVWQLYLAPKGQR